MRYELNLR